MVFPVSDLNDAAGIQMDVENFFRQDPENGFNLNLSRAAKETPKKGSNDSLGTKS